MAANSNGWVGPIIAVGFGIVLGIIGIVLLILYFRNKLFTALNFPRNYFPTPRMISRRATTPTTLSSLMTGTR